MNLEQAVNVQNQNLHGLKWSNLVQLNVSKKRCKCVKTFL